MSRFIVMTATAQMPSSVRSPYRHVAVVEVEPGYDEDNLPKMISPRAKGVVRIVEKWERLNVGKSDRSAYQRALIEAYDMALKLNAEVVS